jgi:putative flippase GtrA
MSETAGRISASGAKRLRGLIFEAARFVGSGLIVFPVGLLVSAFCHEVLGWREEYSAFVAVAVLLVVNFVLGRVFVFRSTERASAQFPRFLAIALVMRGVEYLMFLAAFRFAKLNYLLAMVAALVISSAIKFALYRTWVFKANG